MIKSDYGATSGSKGTKPSTETLLENVMPKKRGYGGSSSPWSQKLRLSLHQSLIFWVANVSDMLKLKNRAVILMNLIPQNPKYTMKIRNFYLNVCIWLVNIKIFTLIIIFSLSYFFRSMLTHSFISLILWLLLQVIWALRKLLLGLTIILYMSASP